MSVHFALLRCRNCKTLWREFPAGTNPGMGASLSLLPGEHASPCCDNVRGDLEELIPTCVLLEPNPPAPPPTAPPPPVDRTATVLADGSPITPDYRQIQPSGMQKDYVVLSPEERAKGFVRPVRRTYRHVGTRPRYPLRDLTAEEQGRYANEGYVKSEDYPESQSPLVGRFWTQNQLDSGCGTNTTMAQSIAETYARDPSFYGSTFCLHCRAHFPVGKDGEFDWVDGGGKVGT